MANLHLFIGSQGSGKSRMAAKIAHGRLSLEMRAKDIRPYHLRKENYEVLILEGNRDEKDLIQIFQWFETGTMRWTAFGNKIIEFPTPDLIATFQTQSISSEWIEKFSKSGAYITFLDGPEVEFWQKAWSKAMKGGSNG